MRIGAIYPQIELHGDPQALRDFARAVEDMGFHHLVMYDHVIGAVHEDREPPLTGPYRETDPFHDPLVGFAHLAALTERLEFSSGVLILPQRQTVLVARQAADVALMCGGRLSLGVGMGWNPVEYEALGMDFKTRGDRLTEQIGLLRRLWSGEVVEHQGKHDRVDRAALNPAPVSPIPLVCGGLSSPAYRRGAKLGDGFIFTGPLEDMALPGWREVRQVMEENGREVDGFRVDVETVGPGFTSLGVDDVLRTLDTWEANGGTHASVKTMGLGYSTLDDHLQHLEKVAKARGLV